MAILSSRAALGKEVQEDSSSLSEDSEDRLKDALDASEASSEEVMGEKSACATVEAQVKAGGVPTSEIAGVHTSVEGPDNGS